MMAAPIMAWPSKARTLRRPVRARTCGALSATRSTQSSINSTDCAQSAPEMNQVVEPGAARPGSPDRGYAQLFRAEQALELLAVVDEAFGLDDPSSPMSTANGRRLTLKVTPRSVDST